MFKDFLIKTYDNVVILKKIKPTLGANLTQPPFKAIPWNKLTNKGERWRQVNSDVSLTPPAVEFFMLLTIPNNTF